MKRVIRYRLRYTTQTAANFGVITLFLDDGQVVDLAPLTGDKFTALVQILQTDTIFYNGQWLQTDDEVPQPVSAHFDAVA